MNLCSSKDRRAPPPTLSYVRARFPFSSAIPLAGSSLLCPESAHNAGQSEMLVLYEILYDSSF